MTRKYIGVSFGDGVYVQIDDSPARTKLDPHLGILPNVTGFSWGNTLSGAQQLGYAILFDALGYEEAKKYRLRYTHRVIAALPKDSGWTISLEEVLKEVTEIKSVEKITTQERQRVAREPMPRDSDRGPGVVWDNEH